MKNKKIAGTEIIKEIRRRGYRAGMRRRNDSSAESVTNKKSRTLVALASREEKAPPLLNFPDPTQYCLPQAKSTAKNFQPSSTLKVWTPNSLTSDTREIIDGEETCLIDFARKKEVLEDSSMGFVIGFIDEEEMFNMPGLVNSMAEGMLLTPPAMERGFKWSHDLDDLVDDANYIRLWGE